MLIFPFDIRIYICFFLDYPTVFSLNSSKMLYFYYMRNKNKTLADQNLFNKMLSKKQLLGGYNNLMGNCFYCNKTLLIKYFYEHEYLQIQNINELTSSNAP